HGGRVARGHPTSQPKADGLGHHHLDESRMLVVSLVAVDVDAQTVFGRQLHGKTHGAFAVLTRQFEMRNPADSVYTQRDSFPHQFLTAVEREDPLLRKGDKLDVHLATGLLANLEERAER